jgi:hypothetical protein
MSRTETIRRLRCSASAGMIALLACAPLVGADVAKTPAIKIAIFDFELEDLTPASALLNEATSSADALTKATEAARKQLAQSGRYDVIDASKADVQAAKGGKLKDCDGCEAGIALKLGADESLMGIVRRATQTDYYVVIQIRDARSGKLLDQQAANFAGGQEGWASGVRMLIKHQILVSQD